MFIAEGCSGRSGVSAGSGRGLVDGRLPAAIGNLEGIGCSMLGAQLGHEDICDKLKGALEWSLWVAFLLV